MNPTNHDSGTYGINREMNVKTTALET